MQEVSDITFIADPITIAILFFTISAYESMHGRKWGSIFSCVVGVIFAIRAIASCIEVWGS